MTWGLEVANVIARAEARELVTEARSETFLEMLAAADIVVDTATTSHALTSALQIARRYRLSAYDASYLELALRQESNTTDSSLGHLADPPQTRLIRAR